MVLPVFFGCLREKAKWKEREEAWLKIENLAKSNPQVSKEILSFQYNNTADLSLADRCLSKYNLI